MTTSSSTGGSFADFNDDGAPDLLLVNGNNTGSSRLALYRNDLAAKGRFTEVTKQFGITDEEGPWWGLAWSDLDGDGDLDVVVTGAQAIVYRNEHGSHFMDVTKDSGLAGGGNDRGLQNPVVADLTGDGPPDIFVGNQEGARFYVNDGAGSFTDATASLGLPPDDLDWTFSTAVADFDQDGRLDVWLGRFWFQDQLLLNEGAGHFSVHGRDVGIITQAVKERSEVDVGQEPTPDVASENTMGLNVGDLDLNGFPDVYIGTGDPARAEPQIVFCAEPDQRTRVRFHRCSEPVRGLLGDSRGHGSAIGDIDHDGDDDLVLNPGGFPPWDAATDRDTREQARILLGEPAKVATAHLRLGIGPGHRSAIGARVQVDGPRRQYLTVESMQGFQSQNSDLLTLLTGPSARVTITWPDGSTKRLTVRAGANLRVDQ